MTGTHTTHMQALRQKAQFNGSMVRKKHIRVLHSYLLLRKSYFPFLYIVILVAVPLSSVHSGMIVLELRYA
jgi:hypothetical protein